MPTADPWPLGRYRLTAKAYGPRRPGADHEVLQPGDEVWSDLRPGWHMEPLDAQALANVERATAEAGGVLISNPVDYLDTTMARDAAFAR
jgi:hypothetical protein